MAKQIDMEAVREAEARLKTVRDRYPDTRSMSEGDLDRILDGTEFEAVPEKVYLGENLCKRNHDFQGTGRSLRWLTSRNCIECHRERSRQKTIRGRPPKVANEIQERVYGLRLSPEAIGRIDAWRKVKEVELPGLRVSRSDAFRMLIELGLKHG